LGGACVEDSVRVEDLNFGADVRLQMIRLPRSARGILFNSPEVALQLAEQYDALQDRCRENIGSLFMDEEGKDRSCRANMEVLIALREKLSKVEGQSNGLAGFKAALTEVALETLREFQATGGSEVHAHRLIHCFPWLGLEAVQVLLGSDAALFTPGKHLKSETVRSILVLEYARHPAGALRKLMSQLPPLADRRSNSNTLSPQHKLRQILKEAVHEGKGKSSTFRLPLKMSRSSVYRPELLETPKEVLSAVRREPYTLQMADSGVVDLLCQGASTHKAKRSTVLEAITEDPRMVLRSIDSSLALVAVEECPGSYNYLSEDLKRVRQILYAALAHDSALQAEFVSTASKNEIQQWQWHLDEQRRKNK